VFRGEGVVMFRARGVVLFWATVVAIVKKTRMERKCMMPMMMIMTIIMLIDERLWNEEEKNYSYMNMSFNILKTGT
jgi:hypothetical protein